MTFWIDALLRMNREELAKEAEILTQKIAEFLTPRTLT